MSLFNGKKEHNDVRVILYIGSGKVSGSLIKLRHDNAPNVIYATEHYSGTETGEDVPHVLQATKVALRDTLKEIVNHGLPHLTFTRFGLNTVKRVHCMLSPAWHTTHIGKVTYEKERDFRVSEHTLGELTKQDSSGLYSDEEGDFFPDSESSEMIENHLMKIELNGYDTPDPIGKAAQSISGSVYRSYASKKILKLTKDEALRHFTHAEILFHTFEFASFATLRNVLGDLNDFLCINVEEIITDILFIKDDALISAASFPFGSHKIIELVAQGIGSVKLAARAALSTPGETVYTLDSAPDTQATTPSLGKAQTLWTESFTSSLEELSAYGSIPKDIFFITESYVVKPLDHFVKTSDFSSLSLSSDALTAHFLDESFFKDKIEYSNYTVRDSVLALSLLYIDANHKTE